MQQETPADAVVSFDHVLESLRIRLCEQDCDALDAAVRGYVEDAIEAAADAAERARRGEAKGGEALAAQLRETTRVAAALLQELRATRAHSWALVDRSLELRRRVQPADASRPAVEAERPLDGLRILVVADSPGLAVKLTAVLCGLGAEVHAALGLRHGVEAARMCRPHVLLCDVPPPAAGAPSLVHDFRREGVIVPTVAVTSSVDVGVREAGRGAGFVAVVASDAEDVHLSDAVLLAAG